MQWRARYTFLVASFFLAGVLSGSLGLFFDFQIILRGQEGWVLLVCLWMVVSSLFWLKGRIFWLIIFPTLFLAGFTRYVQVAWPIIDDNHVAYYVMQRDKKPIAFSALVASDPEFDGSSTRFYLDDIEIDDRRMVGRLLFNASGDYDLDYGDFISATAYWSQPTSFGSFDYRGYLARYSAYGVVRKVDGLSVDSDGRGNVWFATLYKIKGVFIDQIDRFFTGDQAGLVKGVLLGVRSSISEDLLEDFRTVGVTHVIALSGFNITILIVMLDRVFSRLGRKKVFYITLGFIFAFVVMTGAAASIVRAGMMGFLVVLARMIGRQGNIFLALCITATGMVVVSPMILYHDVGFQLSFLATLGLVYFTIPFERIFYFISGLIKDALATTLAAQVFVLPLLIWYFESISLISPLANVVVLPFIPILMLFGFLSVLFGFVSSFFGQIIGVFAELIMRFIIYVCQRLADIPWALYEMKTMTVAFWIIYMAMVLWLLYRRDRIQKIKLKNNP